MATKTIQDTIYEIVKKNEKEEKGKKSISVKVADSNIPIIPLSNITQ